MPAHARRKTKRKPPGRAVAVAQPQPAADDSPRRAAVIVTEKLMLGLFALRGVTIVGASFDAATGNVQFTFTGPICPPCPEGSPAPVVNLESIQYNARR